MLVEYAALDYLAITEILKIIAKEEKITYDETAIKTLARRAGGDARAAINDFQILTQDNKLTKESIESLHDRERQENIIQSLLKVFKTTNPQVALPAFDYVAEDTDKILLWIDENLPKEYKKNEDLARAYEHLSKADIYKGRIRRWQHWRFMVYIYHHLTAGIATAKEEKYPGFSSYKPTMRILKIWQANMKHAKKKAISKKIAIHTHTSTRRVLESTFPYFKEAFRSNKDYAEGMTETLELDKDEVAWLKK
jgi:replication factor C large subunit